MLHVYRYNLKMEILGKCSGIQAAFGESSDIFEKCFNCSNLQKNIIKKVVISYMYHLYNRQNNTWVQVDMEFLFDRSTWYLNFCLHIMWQLTEVTIYAFIVMNQGG